MLGGSGSITGDPLVVGAPPAAEPGAISGRWRGYMVALGFLAPALIFLTVWIVYPAIKTGYRSFFDRSGSNFIWISAT